MIKTLSTLVGDLFHWMSSSEVGIKVIAYVTGTALPLVIYWQSTWWGDLLFKCLGSIFIGFGGALGAFLFTRFLSKRWNQSKTKPNKDEKNQS